MKRNLDLHPCKWHSLPEDGSSITYLRLMPKDLFSAQSDAYAKYRPTYPPELFDYILRFVKEKDCAWDCATGNGQAAKVLAEQFHRVEATDLSEAQLKHAAQKANIHYSVATAEETPFGDDSFDAITIATAYHWFNWKAFYKEATRVGKNGCVVAAWAYHIFYSDDEGINAIIKHFYYDIIKTYWDKERRFVEDRYSSVEFDFEPLPSQDFDMMLQWEQKDFLGYLFSWSAVQNYVKKKGQSPLDLIEQAVQKAWPQSGVLRFHFPIFLKIGRVIK